MIIIFNPLMLFGAADKSIFPPPQQGGDNTYQSFALAYAVEGLNINDCTGPADMGPAKWVGPALDLNGQCM